MLLIIGALQSVGHAHLKLMRRAQSKIQTSLIFITETNLKENKLLEPSWIKMGVCPVPQTPFRTALIFTQQGLLSRASSPPRRVPSRQIGPGPVSSRDQRSHMAELCSWSEEERLHTGLVCRGCFW